MSARIPSLIQRIRSPLVLRNAALLDLTCFHEEAMSQSLTIKQRFAKLAVAVAVATTPVGIGQEEEARLNSMDSTGLPMRELVCIPPVQV